MSFSHKNIITFGGCSQDFMLVVTQSSGSNTARKTSSEKHLFAMGAFKVEAIPEVELYCHRLKTVPKLIFAKALSWSNNWTSCEVLRPEQKACMCSEVCICVLSVSIQIRELTLLMASYINSTHQQKSAAHHLSAPALLLAQSQSGEQHASKSPLAGGGRPSKAPTLLWSALYWYRLDNL